MMLVVLGRKGGNMGQVRYGSDGSKMHSASVEKYPNHHNNEMYVLSCFVDTKVLSGHTEWHVCIYLDQKHR